VECRSNVVVNRNGQSSCSSALTCIESGRASSRGSMVNRRAPGTGKADKRSERQVSNGSSGAERHDGVECRKYVVVNRNGQSSCSSALTCIGRECVSSSSRIVNSRAPGTGNAVKRSERQVSNGSSVAERPDGVECRSNVVVNRNGQSSCSSALTCIGRECEIGRASSRDRGATGTGDAVKRRERQVSNGSSVAERPESGECRRNVAR